jgi:adenylate cyclase
LEMHPEMRICIELKGWATAMKGDLETALKLFEEVHRLTNHPLKAMMGLGYCYGQMGKTEKAMECIHKIEQRQIEEPEAVVDGDLAVLWFALGDMDKVFYHINQCVDKRVAPVNIYLEYPVFSELRKDIRYQELKKKVAV